MQFVFFLVFVVAVLLCGSIKVGPLSLRIYMTLLMMVFLIMTKRPSVENLCKIRTDYILLFLLCIGTLGLSLGINGGLIEYAYGERCLAYYFVCIVAYFAVDRCVKNNKQIDMLVSVMSLIVLLDAYVTILQYQNNSLGWSIGTVFSEMDDFAEYLDYHVSYEGVSKLPGIIGRPVTNGFFLAVATPILLVGIKHHTRSKLIFVSYIRPLFFAIVIFVALTALFFLQQRAAFFLIWAIIAYHLLRELFSNPFKMFIPVVALLLIALMAMPSNMGDIEMGRLSEIENSSRTGLWSTAFSVISENPLFGDILRYKQLVDKTAHNVLLDSFIDSGLIGFLPMLWLFLKTTRDSLMIMRNSTDDYSRVFSYCVLISMAMGLFHNTSYLTGDVIIFLSLALMFKSQIINKYQAFKKK